MSDRASHWDGIYQVRRAQELGWYQARPEASLGLIARLGIKPGDALIDIGGGASNLVDLLVGQGFDNLTVLDISAAAVSAVKQRLGSDAGKVGWLIGDITQLKPQGPFRLWHDRAVFHFLLGADDRRAYIDAMSAAVPTGSFAIMATFAEDGPERCSNLPVRRYSPEQLAAELAPHFSLLESLRETHVTPGQVEQKFIYCCFRRN